AQYRHALPLVLSFLARGFHGPAGQPLVFLDRKDDDHRTPMLLDHHWLGPRFVDQLAEVMLGLAGRHGLHGPLPDLWSEWSQSASEVNERRYEVTNQGWIPVASHPDGTGVGVNSQSVKRSIIYSGLQAIHQIRAVIRSREYRPGETASRPPGSRGGAQPLPHNP